LPGWSKLARRVGLADGKMMLKRAYGIRLMAFGLLHSQFAATRSSGRPYGLHLWCD
jgi:hypothetical protein